MPALPKSHLPEVLARMMRYGLPGRPSLPEWINIPLPPPLQWPRSSEPEPPPLPDAPEIERSPRDSRVPALEYVLHPAAGNSGRVLVLLRGINTRAESYADQINHWQYLVGGVSDLYSRVVYFSYNASDTEKYSELDTHKSIWTHHRPLLFNLLASCYDQGWRSFDIVGHSLGGVVASEYIMHHGLAGPQRGWVRHVITLDSPVNGSSRIAANDFAYEQWFRDFEVDSALEMADLYLDRAHYERIKTRTIERLREAGIAYWNLTSLDDWVVPVEDAILSTHYRAYRLGKDWFSREPSLNRGHAQVFQSERVRDDLRAILSTDGSIQPAQITSTARNIPLPDMISAPASEVMRFTTKSMQRFADNRLLRLGMYLTRLYYIHDDDETATQPPQPSRWQAAMQRLNHLRENQENQNEA